VRVGIIVLFFGIAFLLKYAADNSLLPIEFRLAGVALAAAVLLGLGWRIGERRGAYGLILQGGGVGALYLTVFAATRLYHLLPAGAALPLLIAICGLSAFLAVRRTRRRWPSWAARAAFLAPVLLSTGGGNHVMLFSYYALLNAGIFAIAWFKAGGL
jgi:Predicted membrane protein